MTNQRGRETPTRRRDGGECARDGQWTGWPAGAASEMKRKKKERRNGWLTLLCAIPLFHFISLSSCAAHLVGAVNGGDLGGQVGTVGDEPVHASHKVGQRLELLGIEHQGRVQRDQPHHRPLRKMENVRKEKKI